MSGWMSARGCWRMPAGEAVVPHCRLHSGLHSRLLTEQQVAPCAEEACPGHVAPCLGQTGHTVSASCSVCQATASAMTA